MTAASRAVAVPLGLCLYAAALGCDHSEIGREISPRSFVGMLSENGGVGIVTTDALEACLQGDGNARFLRFLAGQNVAEQYSFGVDCARILPLTRDDLDRAIRGGEGEIGSDGISGSTHPIVVASAEYRSLSAEWVRTEFLLSSDDDVIRLVERSHGTGWGREVSHTYKVGGVNGRRFVSTMLSLERSFEFDPGPRAVLGPAVGEDEGFPKKGLLTIVTKMVEIAFEVITEAFSDVGAAPRRGKPPACSAEAPTRQAEALF